MRLDLHLHTTCSDGLLGPEALVAAAAAAGLNVIAVTDHDTTAGVGPARRAAQPGPLRVISGIELSCTDRGTDFHMLGYGVDHAHDSLTRVTARLATLRRERVADIVGRLAGLGVAITPDDVAPPPGNVAVGRPHIAVALVRLGKVATVQEAFARWLRDGGPAHVPHRGPTPEEGIGAIHLAGGLAVWAHPAPDDAARFGALRGLGLDGVEALRPPLAPALSLAIEQAARAAGLLISGGSDWHGAARPALGTWFVTERHIPRLVERLGIATS